MAHTPPSITVDVVTTVDGVDPVWRDALLIAATAHPGVLIESELTAHAALVCRLLKAGPPADPKPVPSEPPVGTMARDVEGQEWHRRADGMWWDPDGEGYWSWADLNLEHGPLTIPLDQGQDR